MTKSIRLTVEYAKRDRRDKFAAAVDALAHEMGVECLCKSEQGEDLIPLLDFIRAKYTEKMKLLVEATVRGVMKAFGMMDKAAEGHELLQINGNFIISPKDGHYLTVGEWRALMKQVSAFIDPRAEEIGLAMSAEAAIAGIMAPALEAQGVDMATAMYSTIMPAGMIQHEEKAGVAIGHGTALDAFLTAKGLDEKDFRVSLVNLQQTADYCTDMADNVKAGIKDMVRTAVREQWSTSKLRGEMFDTWATMNRDWDRIARSELNSAYAQGTLESYAAEQEPGEKIYLIGRSAKNACAVCQRDVNGVVALLTKGPVGDGEEIDDEYAAVAVWPGKNSVGHGARERWTAVGRHPSCGCLMTRYYPGTKQ